MTDEKPSLDEYGPNKQDIEHGLKNLRALHEVSWATIQDAYVRVRQEVTDHTLTLEERQQETTTKIREIGACGGGIRLHGHRIVVEER